MKKMLDFLFLFPLLAPSVRRAIPGIGGADGVLGRGMQWQGLSLRMTLLHEPTPWIPSSYMPTLAGRLFYVRELAGPLEADCH